MKDQLKKLIASGKKIKIWTELWAKLEKNVFYSYVWPFVTPPLSREFP